MVAGKIVIAGMRGWLQTQATAGWIIASLCWQLEAGSLTATIFSAILHISDIGKGRSIAYESELGGGEKTCWRRGYLEEFPFLL
jgi:hypothetical protein